MFGRLVSGKLTTIQTLLEGLLDHLKGRSANGHLVHNNTKIQVRTVILPSGSPPSGILGWVKSQVRSLHVLNLEFYQKYSNCPISRFWELNSFGYWTPWNLVRPFHIIHILLPLKQKVRIETGGINKFELMKPMISTNLSW